jgi:hypothetical protein
MDNLVDKNIMNYLLFSYNLSNFPAMLIITSLTAKLNYEIAILIPTVVNGFCMIAIVPLCMIFSKTLLGMWLVLLLCFILGLSTGVLSYICTLILFNFLFLASIFECGGIWPCGTFFTQAFPGCNVGGRNSWDYIVDPINALFCN